VRRTEGEERGEARDRERESKGGNGMSGEREEEEKRSKQDKWDEGRGSVKKQEIKEGG
jgi:hypothetical protein